MTAPQIWQKSTYSQEETECVELTATDRGAVLIRESDDPAVVLTTTPQALARFLSSLKAVGGPERAAGRGLQ